MICGAASRRLFPHSVFSPQGRSPSISSSTNESPVTRVSSHNPVPAQDVRIERQQLGSGAGPRCLRLRNAPAGAQPHAAAVSVGARPRGAAGGGASRSTAGATTQVSLLFRRLACPSGLWSGSWRTSRSSPAEHLPYVTCCVLEPNAQALPDSKLRLSSWTQT